MAKDKKKDGVKLKPVEEGAGEDRRVVRLHEDKVEEYEDEPELPVVKVGAGKPLNEDGEPMSGEEKTGRSQEPDVGVLIESEFHDMEDDWEHSEMAGLTIPLGWVALLALFFTTGIVWSIIQVRDSVGRRIEVENDVKAVMEAQKRSVLEAEVTLATIEKVTIDYFDSRSVDELLKHVRHSERVKPLMEEYYEKVGLKPRVVAEFSSLDPVTLDNRANFWFANCLLDDGSETQVLVEVLSEKDAKVDWETHVVYQPIPWDEFAAKREGGSTESFRVFAEEDHFYSHEFADSENLVSLRLTSLHSSEVLYGYVERNSAVWGEMEMQLEKTPGRPSPMILRLHVPGGLNSPRGVVIREMIAPRWLFIDNPKNLEHGRK